MAGSTRTSRPHFREGRGWFFPRAHATKIYSKLEAFIWRLAGLLTASGDRLGDSSVLTRTQGGRWEKRKDGLPTGQAGLPEEELRAEEWHPQGPPSWAGSSRPGPPGLPLAGWTPPGTGDPSSSGGRRIGAAGSGTHGPWRWPSLGEATWKEGLGPGLTSSPPRPGVQGAPHRWATGTEGTQVPTGFGPQRGARRRCPRAQCTALLQTCADTDRCPGEASTACVRPGAASGQGRPPRWDWRVVASMRTGRGGTRRAESRGASARLTPRARCPEGVP